MLLKAQLAEAKQELERLEILADGLIAEVRLELNPVADSFVELDLDKARGLFEELYRHWKEARRLSERIARLVEALEG